MKSDAEKRENLLDLYVRTEQFMAQLDSGFVKTLQTSLGDFNTALKENIKNVKPRDQYIVLVAGKIFKRAINIKSSLSFPPIVLFNE